MTAYVALDAEAHRNIRIRTDRSAELGDEVSAVPVIPQEVPRLIAEYPIVATKDPETGQFRLSALFGFAPGENLFLRGDVWAARYVPLHIQRQPFMVGAKAGSDPSAPEFVMTLNMESPRISQETGEALFTEDGTASPFLERMNAMLSELIAGENDAKRFLTALMEHQLLESLHISFEQADGERITVEGLYSISEERLRGIDAQALGALHGPGFLELIFVMKASLAHIGAMIEERNRRL